MDAINRILSTSLSTENLCASFVGRVEKDAGKFANAIGI